MECVFEISIDQLRDVPPETMLRQASRALELRTEQQSREQLPGLWKVTDKLRSMPKASDEARMRRRLHRTLWSILCLGLGIFILVPGAMEPRNPMLLLTGVIVICLSLFNLLMTRKQPKDPFLEPAKNLMLPLYSLPEGVSVRIRFSEAEMVLEAAESDEGRQTIPYRDFECVIEMDNLFLLVYAGKATVLPKSCIPNSELEAFRALLSSQISLLQA